MKIVTYATHRFGTYNELVNNPYTKVHVLGFGTPWTGFRQKFESMLAFAEEEADHDELLVFLDGFDTIISKDPTLDVPEMYLNMYKGKLLVSMEINQNSYIKRKVFGSSEYHIILNSGMYIGSAGIIVTVLKTCLEHMRTTGENDDQIAMNIVSHQYYPDLITIDTQCNIMYNVPLYKRKNLFTEKTSIIESAHEPSNTAYFISFPGQLTTSRFIRGLKEYWQYFVGETVLFFFFIVICICTTRLYYY